MINMLNMLNTFTVRSKELRQSYTEVLFGITYWNGLCVYIHRVIQCDMIVLW